MDFNKKPWWMTDTYDDESETGPLDLNNGDLWGPNGASMTSLWEVKDGVKTGPGWGREEFMGRYLKREFSPRRILFGYNKRQWNYAWIMRGSRLLCIDIDGKNGGLEYASQLGFLPPTAAETSKSGNGYHLFYLTDDTWDDNDGFGRYRDHIGIVTGVDIRGAGCVYHYPTQRWNHRLPAALPTALATKLLARSQERERQASNIKKVLALDPEEILLMQDAIITELTKPIPAGKRNNTLFALGVKMRDAEIEDWDERLLDRGTELGLDDEELVKLIKNIEKYAP